MFVYWVWHEKIEADALTDFIFCVPGLAGTHAKTHKLITVANACKNIFTLNQFEKIKT